MSHGARGGPRVHSRSGQGAVKLTRRPRWAAGRGRPGVRGTGRGASSRSCHPNAVPEEPRCVCARSHPWDTRYADCSRAESPREDTLDGLHVMAASRRRAWGAGVFERGGGQGQSVPEENASDSAAEGAKGKPPTQLGHCLRCNPARSRSQVQARHSHALCFILYILTQGHVY